MSVPFFLFYVISIKNSMNFSIFIWLTIKMKIKYNYKLKISDLKNVIR